MSTLDPKTLRRELLLDQAMNNRLDALVCQANLTAAKLQHHARMEKNQLRNLLNVAVQSRSVEVVINFIRYQIARNESAWGKGPEDFGHQVIEDIRSAVKGFAATTVTEVQAHLAAAEQLGQAEAEALHQAAYVRLTQLYLGYLNRAFYYGKETGEFDKLKEIANAR
jgi:hypothetical protein